MDEYVKLTIDGAKIRAIRGAPVLDVALEYGICIPHLCHAKDLTPIGVCRLCIVEVVRGSKSKITTSCTLEAEEGMVILAHSEKIRKIRKNIAEMLLAEAPNSRAIQDIALLCGVKKVRYPVRDESCVLCGLCIRACGEIWRSKSLGFAGRGKERHVALPFDKRPEFCKRCDACIDFCPMTITPCPGPLKEGGEAICGLCESQLSMAQEMPGSCVDCRLGEGFNCINSSKKGE
jgi:NADH dehydrogenase/NADH:ubiquinone oxidoreductase subunit G